MKTLIILFAFLFSFNTFAEQPNVTIIEKKTYFLYDLVEVKVQLPISNIVHTLWTSTDLVNWERSLPLDTSITWNGSENYTFFVRHQTGGNQRFFRVQPLKSPHYQFVRNLNEGMSGDDVAELQAWLCEKGFLQTSEGSSLTAVTGYYGAKTKQAVAALQVSVGISPASGYFGPLTRMYVNENFD